MLMNISITNISLKLLHFLICLTELYKTKHHKVFSMAVIAQSQNIAAIERTKSFISTALPYLKSAYQNGQMLPLRNPNLDERITINVKGKVYETYVGKYNSLCI